MNPSKGKLRALLLSGAMLAVNFVVPMQFAKASAGDTGPTACTFTPPAGAVSCTVTVTCLGAPFPPGICQCHVVCLVPG